MNKSSNTIKTIVEVGLFAALGFVLDEIQGIAFASVFTAGGSIGFAMVAVLIVAYRRGWLPALLTGFIMGALDLITKAYFISFWQVLLDYILPYMLVGTAGFLKPWFDKAENDKTKILVLCLGAVAGGLLKFLSHFIVGALVWAPMGYDWPIENTVLYSFAYNIAFTGPSIILSGALLVALFKRAPQTICVPVVEKEVREQEHVKAFDYLINPAMSATGIFLFVYYLVVYIQNYKTADKGYAIKISSSGDAVMMMFTGFLMMIIFAVTIILTIKNRQNNRLTTLSMILLTGSHIIYAIAKILICYLDEMTDAKIYFIWMVVAFVLNIIFIGLYLIVKQTVKITEKVAE